MNNSISSLYHTDVSCLKRNHTLWNRLMNTNGQRHLVHKEILMYYRFTIFRVTNSGCFKDCWVPSPVFLIEQRWSDWSALLQFLKIFQIDSFEMFLHAGRQSAGNSSGWWNLGDLSEDLSHSWVVSSLRSIIWYQSYVSWLYITHIKTQCYHSHNSGCFE